MAYSPTNVLPDPVGALTTTECPWFKASIASNWKSSSGKEKIVAGSRPDAAITGPEHPTNPREVESVKHLHALIDAKQRPGHCPAGSEQQLKSHLAGPSEDW